MKSLLIVFASMLAFMPCFAQFSKGDKFIAGGFSIQTRKDSDNATNASTDEQNTYSLNPSIGFFIDEKLALGVKLGYSNFVSKNFIPRNYQAESNADDLSAGLFARRYFQISEKFFFLINGGIDYSRGNSRNTTIDFSNNITFTSESKYAELTLYVAPAFVFFPSSKWGIEAGFGSLSYASRNDLDSKATINRFNANYGSFSIGFAYYIKK